MAIQWVMFLPALLLLFYPVEVLLPKSFYLKDLSYLEFSETGANKRAPWSFPALWSDGLRSFLGAFLLRSAWAVEPSAGWLHRVPYVMSFCILALSLVVQMHTKRTNDRFLAPVSYVAGLWLALLPLPVALVTVMAAGVCMVAFRSLGAFFFCGAATVAGFGHVIMHTGLWSVVAAAIGAMPWMVGLTCQRRLAVPFRVHVIKEHRRYVPVTDLMRMAEAERIEV